MSLLMIFPAPGPAPVVRLVTGETATPGMEAWRIAAIAIGLGALVAVAVISWRGWRGRPVDAVDAAFVIVARRMRLGAGATVLLRRAAEAHGCAPVALLLSRTALEDAIAALGSSGSAAEVADADAVMRPG